MSSFTGHYGLWWYRDEDIYFVTNDINPRWIFYLFIFKGRCFLPLLLVFYAYSSILSIFGPAFLVKMRTNRTFYTSFPGFFSAQRCHLFIFLDFKQFRVIFITILPILVLSIFGKTLVKRTF